MSVKLKKNLVSSKKRNPAVSALERRKRHCHGTGKTTGKTGLVDLVLSFVGTMQN